MTSGQFRSAEAVLCEGLRLRQEREELGKPDFEVSALAELEAKLLVGLEQWERGQARAFPASKCSPN